MHRLGVYKGIAYAMTAVSLILYILGTTHGGDSSRDFYISAVLAAIVVATCAVLVSLEKTVDRVMRREFTKSRAVLAATIAKALADELEERDAPNNVHRMTGTR